MPSPLALLVLASIIACAQPQATNFVVKDEVEIKWPDPLCGDFNSVRFKQGTVVVTTGPATPNGSALRIKPGTAAVYFACFEPFQKTNPREKYFVSSSSTNFPSKKLVSAEERRLTVKPTSFVLTSGDAGLIIRCLPSTVPDEEDACFNSASELVDSLRVSTPTISARFKATSGVQTTSATGDVKTSWIVKPTTPVTFIGVDPNTGKTLFSTTLGIGTVNLTIQYTRFTNLKVDKAGELP